jgi:hypothetical protein
MQHAGVLRLLCKILPAELLEKGAADSNCILLR